LIILDACLNNPFRTGADAAVSLPDQTLIAYATAPGSLAAEGARLGLYTEELARALAIPAANVAEVFARVGSAVSRASGGLQTPWIASSLSTDIRLGTASPSLPPLAPRLAMSDVATRSRGILPKESAYELAFWESIKDSTHASDYEAYLEAYPKGRFAALARSRIERLRAAESKGEETTKRTKPAPAPESQPKAVPPARPAKAPEGVRPAPASPPAPQQPARSTKEPEPVRAAPVPPPAAPHPAASQSTTGEITDCAECPTLVGLRPGSFTMGNNSSDPSERPAHKVTISAAFAIGKYEVTVEQWNACVAAGACPRVSPDFNRIANAPIRDVSWDDAQVYIRWLKGVSGKSYRLPTEAEWEYAARGGTSTAYWWGEQMRGGGAICKGCGEPSNREEPATVGSATANAYGLHDMNGNVWEWVSDCWHNSYKGAPADGSTWDEHDCRARVIRGGSWRNGPSYMLSSTRFKYDANVRFSEYGFRVARTLK
jgi:formylglycine-generating enzyme required for sulfatase activity